MTGGRLQTLIDTARATSPQRWLLFALAASSPVVASAVIAAGSGKFSSGSIAMLCLIAGLAIAAAAFPDAHTGLVIIGLVVWQWMASVDDVATIRSLAVAICLIVMHSSLALMAVTPFTAVVDRFVLVRSARRLSAVCAATVAVWLLVLAFDGVTAQGNTILVFLALSTVIAGLLALREFGGRNRPPGEM